MGFTKTVLKKGNGIKPQQGQTVTVHCTGYGKDSDLTKPFWSTHDEGQQPFSFAVGEGHVIKGMYTAALVCVYVCNVHSTLPLSLTHAFLVALFAGCIFEFHKRLGCLDHW